MYFLTSTSSQCSLHGVTMDAPSADQPLQVLEVRFSSSFRLVDGFSNQILYENAPLPLHNATFPLPVHQFHDPLFLRIYISQLLSLNLNAAASELSAAQLASSVLQMTAQNTEVSFHIVAFVHFIQTTRIQSSPVLYPVPTALAGMVMAERTEVAEETPPAMKKMKVEKLEEIGEDSGDCIICLDEFDCNKRAVVKIPCGHVYHESCLFRWLKNNHSCPLCRSHVPLEDSTDNIHSFGL